MTDLIEQVIKQVAGSMAIEGFVLSEEDKERIRRVAEGPEVCEEIIQSLIQKHTAKGDDLVDPSTGTKLTPSLHGRECLGNGSWPGYECCCDECDYYLECFPDWKPGAIWDEDRQCWI